MKRFVAFLRGINVGGKNIIKMADLTVCFESAGLKNTKTYIQSGNVIFDADTDNVSALKLKIEGEVEKCFNKSITVIIRTKEGIEKLVDRDPFKDHPWGVDSKLYICFLEEPPVTLPSLPIKSEKEALVLTEIIDLDAILISLPFGDGHYGFPNPFIEKELRVLSTARNWNTVLKIQELLTRS